MNHRPIPNIPSNSHFTSDLQSQRLEYLRSLPYPQFEALMRRMLLRCGLHTVRSLGGGQSRKEWGEGGFDLLALQSDKLTTHLVGIQIKQLRENVCRRHVDELRGALLRWRIESGFILTTSGFGPKCREAESLAILPAVRLLDGPTLLSLLEEVGLLGTNEVWPQGFEPELFEEENAQDAESPSDWLSPEESAAEFWGKEQQTRAWRRENRKKRRLERRTGQGSGE